MYFQRPHPAQEQILFNRRRFNVLRCGRRFGKTALIALLIAEASDPFGRKPLPVGVFVPVYKIMLEVWKELVDLLAPITLHRSEAHKTLRLRGGGLIEFWSMEDPRAGRSRKYGRVIIDEAAFAPHLEESWTRAIRPTLADYQGDAYFMSSPNGVSNYFFTLSERCKILPDWREFHYTSYDNPYINPAEIDSVRDSEDPLVFQQEWLAEFVDITGSPFVWAWNKERHVALTQRVEGLPVYFSFDFNKRNSLLVAQLNPANRRVRFLEEYYQGGVGLDLEHLVGQVTATYANHHFFITGDASGNAANALTASNMAAYGLINRYLKEAGRSETSYKFTVPKANPRTENVRFTLNALLKHCDIVTPPSMTGTLGDLIRVKVSPDGSLNKEDMDKYDYGHRFDAWRYLLFNYCRDWVNVKS